jgi:HEAT repeat protein
MIVAVGLVLFSPASAAEQGPPAVEEWQVRGIVAALKDGYPEVRALAAKKLAELFQFDRPEGNLREWRERIRDAAKQAVPALRELLNDEDSYAHRKAAEALGGLGDKQAVPALRELLKEEDSYARLRAAEALGRMGDKQDVPALRKLLKDKDAGARSNAAEALARLYEGAKDVPALRELLKEEDAGARSNAAEALARLYEGAKDVPALRELLKGEDVYARLRAAEVLGRMGDKQDVPALRKLLKDETLFIRRVGAEALARLYEGTKDVPALRELLKDDVVARSNAAEALARLYEGTKDMPALRELLKGEDRYARQVAAEALGRLGDKQAVPALRELLKDKVAARRQSAEALARLYEGTKDVPALRELLKEEDADARSNAVEALARLYEGAKDVPALRELLKGEDRYARQVAAEALGRLGDKQAAPALRELLKDEDDYTRLRAAEVLGRMGESVSIIALSIPYEDTSRLYLARWLAYHWGGKNPEATKVLCDYLGRPAKAPDPPKSREDARKVLQALGNAWDKSDSRLLSEDAAGWVAWIITERANDWSAEDVPELQNHLERFKKDEKNWRWRAYAVAIHEIIKRLTIWPPPWVWTLLAVAGVNLLAVLLFVVLRGHGGLARWLPFLTYSFAGISIGLADILRMASQVHLNVWLLAGLLLGELLLLVAAGLVSPPLLRRIARIEPLNRIAVPLAMYWPRSRRRFFRAYVDDLRQQMKYKKERANHEEYQTLPANVRSSENPVPSESQDPATEVLRQLAEAAGTEQVRSVLVSAVGGRGKSALINRVVERALDEFEASPTNHPLPVLLSGSEEARDVDRLVERAIGPVLASPELLLTHLRSGDFFLVFDGITEGGPTASALTRFARGAGSHTPLLLGARPSAAYEEVVRSRSEWMTVEPLPLDDNTLNQFIAGYNGQPLHESVKKACRGADGRYVPLLVRMALAGGASQADGVRTVADLYFGYLMQLFQSEFPDDSEKKLNRLGKTARWCVETYWKDGERRQRYDGKDLQKALLGAGVLVADRSENPREVWFVHDTLQSYLTAEGLWRLDGKEYAEEPKVTKEGAWFRWTRGHVLLRAAADPEFTKAQADIVISGESELFQMCVAVFGVDSLRPFLRDEVKRWAEEYYDNMRKNDIRAALPAEVLVEVQSKRNVKKLLKKAAELSFERDQKDDGRRVVKLYAGVAPG